METANHECYVSLEVAKLLKQAVFDWEGTAYYQHGVFYPYAIDRERLVVMNQSSAPDYMEQYSAPTLEVAQRWLREVKRINVEVMYLFEPCNYYFARACYLDTNKPLYIPNPLASTIYEEALESGIKKALEIILEKGE